MNLLIFILVAVSATNILVNEYIMGWFRNLIAKYFPFSLLRKLISCSTCLGFWVGAGLYWLFPYDGNIWIAMILAGLVSSICNKIIDLTLMRF